MKTALLYNPDLKKYSFGIGHPLSEDRFEKFFIFFESRFAKYKNSFEKIVPEPADDNDLALAHTKDFINAIRAASSGEALPDIYRYVSADNLNPVTGYVPKGIEEGARTIVGISLEASELIAQGKFDKAIGIGGGMHHAKPNYAEGFCYYNDVAVAVLNIKKKYGVKKILVLDTDAHAGNGTKEIFYDDPQVLFIDIHQDPQTIYPGSGFINEIGGGNGRGFTVNIPVLPKTGNRAYKYIFDELIFPLAYEFKPEVIVRYGGSDPHYLDILTDLGISLSGLQMIGKQVNILSKDLTGGRSIDLLLSGYNMDILPFAWSAIIAGLLDLDLDLSDFNENDLPSENCRLKETKEIVGSLKKILKQYWKCMEK